LIGRVTPASVSVPLTVPPPPASGLEPGRGEDGFGIAVGPEGLPRRRADLAPVPVGERLEAAGALAHDQGAHVDPYLKGSRREVVTDGQLAGPPGCLDRQVMTSLGSHSVAGCPQDNPATVRAEWVAPCLNRHGSTVRHMWGGVQWSARQVWLFADPGGIGNKPGTEGGPPG
jgi:hypothetical protein